MKRFYILIILLVTNFFVIEAQYISQVLEYKPAPGQFINSKPWGVPQSAKSLVGGVTGSMSLGAFGGYMVFRFENPVENHPDNPFGVDFTIFGNPLQEWSEQGIVSVMKDENGNGLPDDTWYELAGSDYFFFSTRKGYQVTYTNPNQAVAADVPWADNLDNSGFVLKNGFHTQPYYPLSDSFPAINATQYTLSGTKVADEVDRTIPTYIKSYRKPFGYVDNQLRGVAPYTLPDNPYTPDKENSGGDAFDINWAVDESGNYVDLDVIHFVKVHNAILAGAGWLGEVSTEITGAVDVEPNSTVNGQTDMVILKGLPDTITGNTFQIETFAYHKGRCAKSEALNWISNMPEATISTDNQLTFSKSGKLILTASLAGKPEIMATDSTILQYSQVQTTVPATMSSSVSLYPNPASNYLYVSGAENASLDIYNITGSKVMDIDRYSGYEPINIGNLPQGVYIIRLRDKAKNISMRFIKK